MISCECGGDLLRHGVTRYKEIHDVVGIRYKCRECGTTKTVRVSPNSERLGVMFSSTTGRPTIKDFRHVEWRGEAV